jgi:hypothetical protein
VAAVERRRVVRLDRAEVARAVRVDGHHPADRELCRVQAPKHAQDVTGDVAMDDDPPDVHATVEAPVRRPDEPEIVEPDRASRLPRNAGHRLPQRLR